MREDMLLSILNELNGATADIEGSAVISNDGLLIASVMPASFEEERVGAMTSAMLSLATRTSKELKRGHIDHVIVKGDHGYAIMLTAGQDAMLCVLARSDAKLGLVMLDASRAAENIPRVL